MTKPTFLEHELSYPSFLPPTAWLRHGPFAMWLVKAARPKQIVELGTHNGFSYFSFCQAVQQAGLPTRCVAVDTWRGDEHSGHYGPEVFRSVQAENKKYDAFSKLLRKTFADALNDIKDGTVDLLHIDGRHFYDDVKEDFESWLPKLAERAVVLFHDTEVREHGFGVWRYWGELAVANPTFNFTFQNGLGILFHGEDMTSEMASFRRAVHDEISRNAINALFWSQGEALACDYTCSVLAKSASEDWDALKSTLLHLERGEVIPEDSMRPLGTGGKALTTALADMVDRLQNALSDYDSITAQMTEMTKASSQHTGNTPHDLETENQRLRHELAEARSNIVSAWKDKVKYTVLRGVVLGNLPISQRMRERFSNSARKRDPRRSLAEHEMGTDSISYFPASNRGKAKFQHGRQLVDAKKKNVLVVSHEASRTGAPILAQNIALRLSERYNVTVMSIRGGEILDSFLDVSVEILVGGTDMQRGCSTWRLLKHHFSKRPIDFALVNSVESRQVLPLLDELGVASICLIHEFASMTTQPELAFGLIMKSSDEVVFSSARTLDSAAVSAALEFSSRVHVIPQGKCVVPSADRAQVSAAVEQERLKARIRPHGGAEEFVVIGAGYIEPRKGVDLFIEVARQALTRSEGRKLRFFWIGDGLSGGHHPDYARSIQDQLARSGMVGNVEFLPKTAEIQYVYELSDLLLLPSRLDPLPNVAIDAMYTGVPVLCFDAATGLTEVLRQGALEEACTAEYLNTSEVTRKLLMLANTPDIYEDVSKRSRQHARAVFDMDTYVQSIEDLALAAKSRRAGRASDVDIISAEPNFQPSYVLPFGSKSLGRKQAAQHYVSLLSTDVVARRPEPGFNPDVYAQHLCEIAGGQVGVDPYAEFLRQGRPDGSWRLPVICEPEDAALSDRARALRVSLHVHAYYVDQLEELLRHLAANSARPDLYISVTNEASARHAKSLLHDYAFDHTVQIVPNCGRDIGPLLTEFGPKLVEEYDIVGHVHTKKSIAVSDERIVRTWTRFLYENVLGGEKGGAMMDKSLNAFALDDGLGIVFPSDPNLIYWSRNRDHPERLAKQLGLGDLPRNFDFPIGTMFWMRSEVMRRFVDLNLDWADYPGEPIPNDGTMLHALERLFGIVPALLGYRAAVTYVTGLTR